MTTKETLLLQNIQKKIDSIKSLTSARIQGLAPFKAKTGNLTGAEHPGVDDSDWNDFHISDEWGGPDVTCWFRIPFRVPVLKDHEKLAAVIQPGKRFTFISSEGGDWREYELMIYLDGEPLQSVDVRRNEIPLWDKVKPGSEHLLAIQAFSGLVLHRHRFLQSDLVAIDIRRERLYYDAKTLFDTVTVLAKDHLHRKQLLHQLDQALLEVDFIHQHTPAFDESIARAQENLSALYAEADLDRSPRVMCVGHSHLDIAWKWETRHSVKKAARTFANALRLMELYPDYRFSFGQPQAYRYVQHHYPPLFERVKQQIAKGSWEATGGMWVESDCNLPDGESLVRQFLLGKRYFQQTFGKDVRVAWLPDVFGFCWSLPQIIKKSGLRYFMTTKLSWNQFTEFPHDTFYWQGLDGTRILAHLITTPDRRGWNDYSVDLDAASVKGCWDNYRQQELNDEVLLSFGWGDGGGGPTASMLEQAQRLPYMNVLPLAKQGHAEPFFRDLEKRISDLPVWNDELYLQLHRGTYTSQARIKKYNRDCQVLYHNAELLSAIHYLRGAGYPHEKLNKGWELILLNQFHDILPGSSIPEVYTQCEKEYQQVIGTGRRCIHTALTGLSDARHENDPDALMIWNSLSHRRSDVVTLDAPAHPVEIRDESGKVLPAQLSGKQLLVYAERVPSMGYKSVRMSKANSSPNMSSSLKVTTQLLENRYFRISIDENGLLSSIYDKQADREVLANGQGNVFQVFEDRPIANDAWDIDYFYEHKHIALKEVERIEVTETGPIRAGVLIERRFLQSTIRQTIYIFDQLPRIDFATVVDWQQPRSLLKVAFPVAVHHHRASYDIPFGHIERPTHRNTAWDQARFEVPAQKWADLSEGDYGVSLINDCKHGYDIYENTLRLTLIKASVDPDPHADIGEHRFRYALYPHAGDWSTGGTSAAAFQFNFPLLAHPGGPADGNPLEFSFFDIDSDNVVIETVKKAEDENALVVRCVERFNQRNRVCIETAFPIKTLWECNLMEEEKQPIEFENRSFRFYISPHEIKTFMIGFD
jgi:alpha-mannosidase